MTAIKFKIEPGRQEMISTRVYDAPRDLVFRAWIDPSLIPAAYLTTTVDRMDPRPGGSWRIVRRSNEGKEFGFHGVYHEVSPERLVKTLEFEGMPGHVLLEILTFEESHGTTTVTEKYVFESVEDRDGMFEAGMKEGETATTTRFGELLERIQRGERKAA